jgi:uncharacterized protein (DUF2235 family)
MSKNIIICCDGTGNQFGEQNSNVVKLYRILQKEQNTQVAFYDPGVGTMSDPDVKTPVAKIMSKLFGLAFGCGMHRNIREAYSYLMENYEDGDRVFLFGFSRGAYTVRVLAGFIRMCGLLEKGCQNLIPYAYLLFKKRKFKVAGRFRTTYARECPIHFLGVWDTVSSVGLIIARKTYPYTFDNDIVKTVRHAVSIDERRTYYRQNLWTEEETDSQDVKQVWFAGVHCDVGGSYKEEECGLSKIALNWMVLQAVDKGLKIDDDKYQIIVLGKDPKGWYCKPDHKAKMHTSLKGVWWLLEFLPKNLTLNRKRFFFPRGKPRFIKEKSLIHRSVIDRKNDCEYDPRNMPEKYEVETH